MVMLSGLLTIWQCYFHSTENTVYTTCSVYLNYEMESYNTTSVMRSPKTVLHQLMKNTFLQNKHCTFVIIAEDMYIVCMWTQQIKQITKVHSSEPEIGYS